MWACKKIENSGYLKKKNKKITFTLIISFNLDNPILRDKKENFVFWINCTLVVYGTKLVGTHIADVGRGRNVQSTYIFVLCFRFISYLQFGRDRSNMRICGMLL